MDTEAIFQDWVVYFNAKEEQGEGLEWVLDLPKSTVYIPVHVDLSLLLQLDPELAKDVIEKPGPVLSIGIEAASRHIQNLAGDVRPLIERYVILRPFNHPEQITISELSAFHIGRLISLNATVSMRGKPGQRLELSVDECRSCGFKVTTRADATGRIPQIPECIKDRGGCGKRGGGGLFSQVMDECEYMDMMKVELEDLHDIDLVGSPEKVEGRLEGELAADPSIRPEGGSMVKITGIYLQDPNPDRQGWRKAEGQAFVQILHIDQEERQDLDITEEDIQRYESIKENALDHITKSIAPHIYGYDDLKEGLALYLFGGAPQEGPGGLPEDSPISLLVVGDPSTGKSKILDGAARLSPRSYKASGKSTTGRGLVAAVVKDKLSDGDYVLKAGVLARADRGHARIDELDKLHSEDQDSLREAMSEGQVPINKGGISATIWTRAAVAAAANPIGEDFVNDLPPYEQNPLSSAIVSRFHLIYYVKKDGDQVRLKEIIRHMRMTRAEGSSNRMDWPYFDAIQNKIQDIRKYIVWARKQGKVRWMDEAGEALEGGAVDLLWTYNEDLRGMEGLERLAEASARSRLSKIVTSSDVDRALQVYEISLRSREQGIRAIKTDRSQAAKLVTYGRVEA